MSASVLIRLLLVEDNPTDVLLVRQGLQTGPEDKRVEVRHAETLAASTQMLRSEEFDAILCDMGLPDSTGLITFRKLQEAAPDTPIVVLTGSANEQDGLQAVKQGAQDYLMKSAVGTPLFARVIWYAIERFTLQAQLAERQQRERGHREMLSIDRLSERPSTTVTGEMFGLLSLQQSWPREFKQFLQEYDAILQQALDRRIYKPSKEDVQKDPETRLRELADQLGFFRAGPRDVIDLHSMCLKNLIADAPLPKSQAVLEEGRIALVELMGYLANYYRSYYSISQSREAPYESRNS